MQLNEPIDHFVNTFITENWIFGSDSLDTFFDNLIHDDILKKQKEIIEKKKQEDPTLFLEGFIRHKDWVKESVVAHTKKEQKQEDLKLSTLISILQKNHLLIPNYLKAYIIYFWRLQNNDKKKQLQFVKDTANKVQVYTKNRYVIQYDEKTKFQINDEEFDIKVESEKFSEYNFNEKDVFLDLYKIISHDANIFITKAKPPNKSYAEILDTLIYKFENELKYHDSDKIKDLFLSYLMLGGNEDDKKIVQAVTTDQFIKTGEVYEKKTDKYWFFSNPQPIVLCDKPESLTFEYNEIKKIYKQFIKCLKQEKVHYNNALIVSIKENTTEILGKSLLGEDTINNWLLNLFKLKEVIIEELHVWFVIYLYLLFCDSTTGLITDNNKKQIFESCVASMNITDLKYNSETITYKELILHKDNLKEYAIEIQQEKNKEFEEQLKSFKTHIFKVAGKEKKLTFGKMYLFLQLLHVLLDKKSVKKPVESTNHLKTYKEIVSKILIRHELPIDVQTTKEIHAMLCEFAGNIKLSEKDLNYYNYFDIKFKTASLDPNSLYESSASDGGKKRVKKSVKKFKSKNKKTYYK